MSKTEPKGMVLDPMLEDEDDCASTIFTSLSCSRKQAFRKLFSCLTGPMLPQQVL